MNMMADEPDKIITLEAQGDMNAMCNVRPARLPRIMRIDNAIPNICAPCLPVGICGIDDRRRRTMTRHVNYLTLERDCRRRPRRCRRSWRQDFEERLDCPLVRRLADQLPLLARSRRHDVPAHAYNGCRAHIVRFLKCVMIPVRVCVHACVRARSQKARKTALDSSTARDDCEEG